MIQASDGLLYGTTDSGGSADKGTLYAYDPKSNRETILHSFGDGSVANDGAGPSAALVQASDGNLYGTTYYGGTTVAESGPENTHYGYGTIFQYNLMSKRKRQITTTFSVPVL